MNEFERFQEIASAPQSSAMFADGSRFWSCKEKPLAVAQLAAAPELSPEGQELPSLMQWLPPEIAGCAMLLCAWQTRDNAELVFWSETDEVRAFDFMQVLCEETGLVRGNEKMATGRLSLTSLEVRMEELNVGSLGDFLLCSTVLYFSECDVIHATEYAGAHRDELAALTLYRKQRISWAYVSTTEIAPEGSRIRIRTLENESGVDIDADNNTYIMIGKQGEVYQIDRSKFEKTYEVTEEAFDLFAQMTLYIPEACILPSEDYVSLDEHAHICYPKASSLIHAKPLSRRMKIFPAYDPDHYFLGHAGDYMAVRPDDLTDIYIIRKNIFQQTYEPVPEE